MLIADARRLFEEKAAAFVDSMVSAAKGANIYVYDAVIPLDEYGFVDSITVDPQTYMLHFGYRSSYQRNAMSWWFSKKKVDGVWQEAVCETPISMRALNPHD